MRYQRVEELTADTRVVRSASDEEFICDRIVLKSKLKESLRYELHNKLRELAKGEKEVETPGLIRYQGIEYLGEDYYAMRIGVECKGICEYQPASLEEAVQVLRHVLKVMGVYHRAGKAMGGVSQGQIKISADGALLLQDPPVFNYLSRFLSGDYEYSLPVEVIKGGEWIRKSDVFSWGELAYKLLTGYAPFGAAQPEDRAAKLLEGVVLEPRMWEPRLSQQLSQLLLSCLAVDARQRPEAAFLHQQFETLVEQGGWMASEAEIKLIEARAAAYRKKQLLREQFWLWWRKYKTGVMIGTAMAVLSVGLWFSPRHSVVTPQTTPLQVVNYYFKGIETIDVSMMDDTLYNAKNNFSDAVGNVHVLNASRQANEMAMTEPDWLKIVVADYKLQPQKQTPTEVTYRVRYTVKFLSPQEIQSIARLDRFTLTRVHKIWRITEIKVFNEKRRTEKLKAEPVKE